MKTKKENELTLRDKFAMSLPAETLPEFNTQEAFESVAYKLGLEWNYKDKIVQIEFVLKYQAAIRYMYADAMLEARKIKEEHEKNTKKTD